MTIAVCYLSPEGVVLGADSTTTNFGVDGNGHYFDFNQKVFELGENSTLGVITWGAGGIGSTSHRTIFARVADHFIINPPKTLKDALDTLIDFIWNEYTSQPEYQEFQRIMNKQPFGNPLPQLGQTTRTIEEEAVYNLLKGNMFVGFCLAGYIGADRIPDAISVTFSPELQIKPTGSPSLGNDTLQWWGVPNLLQRLLKGADVNLRNELLLSPGWTGSEAELDTILARQVLSHATLPIRDAIDYVYTCILCTIKAMKFSSFNQVCGGPIEIAVITTDRKFRWVRHKSWDSAINDGGI